MDLSLADTDKLPLKGCIYTVKHFNDFGDKSICLLIILWLHEILSIFKRIKNTEMSFVQKHPGTRWQNQNGKTVGLAIGYLNSKKLLH